MCLHFCSVFRLTLLTLVDDENVEFVILQNQFLNYLFKTWLEKAGCVCVKQDAHCSLLVKNNQLVI